MARFHDLFNSKGVLVLTFLFTQLLVFGQIPDVPTPLCHYCGNPLPQDPVSTSNPDYARIHHKTTCPYYPKSDTEQTYVNQGPTQQELDAYYNQQWSDQLSQQADIDFRKGMDAFKAGNCDKAVRHLNMARKMVSLKIYEDAYQAAVACKEKGTVVQKPKEDPKPVVSNKPVQVTTQNQNTSSNSRPRGEPVTNNSVQSNSLSTVIAKEQKAMETNTETWVEYQKRQFKIRIEQPNYWCKNYYKELQQLDTAKNPLDTYFPSKKQSQLEVGDVILVGPIESDASKLHAKMDGWMNENNASVTHTLTCVKVVDGKRIFLDNQAATGPRLISEEEFLKRYGDRETSVASVRETVWGVAQPLKESEAKDLWELAKKMVDKNKDNTNPLLTEYGLYGTDDMVCSETSWALLNAAGRFKIPFDKHVPLVSGIEFTPASFYNAQQYFLITPLQMGK